MGKTACIIGGTGLTGRHLIRALLSDDRYDKIVLVGRRICGMDHPKIEERLGDLLKEDFLEESIEGDELYCCIGTTAQKTPDTEMYRDIDYGIPVRAAKAAKEKGVGKVIVISAIGADTGSRIFYNKLKGEMERDAAAVGPGKIYFLRPSLILGKRREFRLGESIGKFIVKTFRPLIPDKYDGVDADVLAYAMLKVACGDFEQRIFESDDIKKLVG